jgi:type VI secretion system secreted protein VgrG
MPLYDLEADFLPATARVVSFDGHEAIHRPYRFRVVFYLPAADAEGVDLDAATAQRATLVIQGEDGPRQRYHGTVASFELVEDDPERTFFAVELVPKLWQLGLGEHSRVFVDKKLPEIIEETLKAGGLGAGDYELRLHKSYEKLAHVCQYRESRLAFVSRWLERVGACFYFEQGDSQEKLVITDDTTAAASRPVRFYPSAEEDVSAHEALRTFRWRHAALPKKVAVADYSPEKPTLAVEGEADVAPEGPGGDVELFNVNEPLPAAAKARADAGALQLIATQARYAATGRVFGLVPGGAFDLEEHPAADLCTKYLVTAVRHHGVESGQAQSNRDPSNREGGGDQREVYRCEVEAVLAEVPYATSHTRWPRVAGTVRARVDGEADSDYAQLDEHGRYLVRILFDESGLPDGGASTRVRMMQPHAGNPEGLHLPLRKDTEVQIAFLRGDPDQPVIQGVVPNKVTPSPVTEQNKTLNVFQTGGLNRSEMDDNQGAEYIDLSTPPENTFAHLGAHAGLGDHNYVFSTDGDYLMHTGGNRDITVGGEQSETVKGNVKEDYHANQTTHVSGSFTETIDSGSTQTIHAGSTQTIDGGVTQEITGGEIRTVTGGQNETLDGGRKQKITGSSLETITGTLTQDVTGAIDLTASGGLTLTATGGITFTTPASVKITAKGGWNLLAPGGQKRFDEDQEWGGGGWYKVAQSQIIILGYRSDYRMNYLEAVGLKVDVFGIKQTKGLDQVTVGGFDSKNSGAIKWTCAHAQKLAALLARGG